MFTLYLIYEIAFATIEIILKCMQFVLEHLVLTDFHNSSNVR